jgi:hypothetical protein
MINCEVRKTGILTWCELFAFGDIMKGAEAKGGETMGTQSNGGSRHRQDRSALWRSDLNRWMEGKGLTVYMLAKLSGVSRETIQGYVLQGKLPIVVNCAI